MQDPVEELAELREQTDVVAQVDERARRRMEPVEAVDESGEVTVRLRPDGRVEQVRVGFAWDRSLSAEEVGPTRLASAIYIFYGAVIAAIVILAAGLLTATGEAISVLGLPAVPPTVITAIVAAVAALSAAILNLRSQATSAQSAFDDVANETSDFGAGGWPRAVI